MNKKNDEKSYLFRQKMFGSSKNGFPQLEIRVGCKKMINFSKVNKSLPCGCDFQFTYQKNCKLDNPLVQGKDNLYSWFHFPEIMNEP